MSVEPRYAPEAELSPLAEADRQVVVAHVRANQRPRPWYSFLRWPGLALGVLLVVGKLMPPGVPPIAILVINVFALVVVLVLAIWKEGEHRGYRSAAEKTLCERPADVVEIRRFLGVDGVTRLVVQTRHDGIYAVAATVDQLPLLVDALGRWCPNARRVDLGT